MTIRIDVTVADLGALQVLHCAEFEDGANAWVSSEVDYFTLDKVSAAAPDGINIIQPIAGAPSAGNAGARWLRLSVIGPGGGLALSGLLINRPPPNAALLGATYYAQDTEQAFYLAQTLPGVYTWIDVTGGIAGTLAARPVASQANMGLTYNATDNGTLYLSTRTGPATYAWNPIGLSLAGVWAAQTNWYLSASGVATASGADAGHPIPPSELSRRLNGITIAVVGLMTLHYDAAGDPTGGLIITWNMPPGTQMLVVGTPTPTGTSGTLTTWITLNNTVTPNSYGFTDAALPAANSWSAFVGVSFTTAPARIRITSGPRAGLCMSVMKDENTNTVPVPKTARVAPPYLKGASGFAYPISTFDSALTVPVAGDPYVVETLPDIGKIQFVGWEDLEMTRFIFKDIALTEGFVLATTISAVAAFYDCHIPFVEVNGPPLVSFTGGSIEDLVLIQGGAQITGVGFLFQLDTQPGSGSFLTNCLFQGAPLRVGDSTSVILSGNCQIFDAPGNPVTTPTGNGHLGGGTLSGDNNAAPVQLSNGSSLTWGTLPTIQNNTGAANNVNMDNVVFPWGNGILYDMTTGTNVHQNGVSVQQGPSALGTWQADVSLTNAAAQWIPRGSTTTQLTQSAGIMQAANRFVSKLDVAYVGNAGNVAGQTITVKIQRSTDHGVTWADLAGATSGPLATTAGGKTASVSFTAVQINEGDLLAAVATPSALLSNAVTLMSVSLK